jgi:hypothetical protein
MSNPEPLDETNPQQSIPQHLLRFKVGELLPWKGTWFEVTELTAEGMTLKSKKSIEKTRHG